MTDVRERLINALIKSAIFFLLFWAVVGVVDVYNAVLVNVKIYQMRQNITQPVFPVPQIRIFPRH